MDNELRADPGGGEDHEPDRAAYFDELIERSSLGDRAARSFYERAIVAGDDTSDVHAILAELDEEEESIRASSDAATPALGAGAGIGRTTEAATTVSGFITALTALRRGCVAHRTGEPQRLDLLALHTSAVLGAQRSGLIEKLMSSMVFTVRRTNLTLFRSAEQVARYWIDTETLPPPVSTPVLSIPNRLSGQSRHEYTIIDDTALVFDRSLFQENTRNAEPRNRRSGGDYEVYWPTEIKVDHEMFLNQIDAFTYKIDLSPHTWITTLQFDHSTGHSCPEYAVGLLWRVVDPIRILRWRRAAFAFLLEAVLDEWRAALRQEVERKGRIDRELRTRIAADECWSNLGVEVSVQLCGQDREGPVDRLDDDGLRFLLEAFRDRRRWFSPTIANHEIQTGGSMLPAAPRHTSLPGSVTVSSRSIPDEVPDRMSGTYAPPRPPVFTPSTESTAPMRRIG